MVSDRSFFSSSDFLFITLRCSFFVNKKAPIKVRVRVGGPERGKS